MTEENKKKKSIKIGFISVIVAAVLLILGLLPFVVPLKENPLTIKLGEEISTDMKDYVTGFLPSMWVAKLDVSEVDTKQVGTYTAKVKQGFREYEIPVTVDTPPTITGMRDYYVIPGTTLNYLEFIEAYDTVDGDISQNVRVNAENVDLSSVGSYELEYICEDSYGLISTETVSINVMESIDIQELINTHQIHRLNDIIVGAYNLYDIGYYDDKTIEEMAEIMCPTTIRITNSTGYGSGFILQILEDEVIIGTCQHVVKDEDTVDISFFDGTKVKGTVVAANWDYDVAFVSVNREDISQELLDNLYTIHINKGYWDALENEADLEVGIRCISDQGTVLRDITGELIYKLCQSDLQWRNLVETTKITVALFSGSSGSNVFDIHGNTMGVAVYVIFGDGKYESYCMTLETLCNKYEEVFGEKLYYY